MTTITDYRTYDLRFPTSFNADGSDAMNKDGDHSAAYVMLLTDDPDLMGTGFTFTIGRGNDVCAQAIHDRVKPLIGRDAEEIAADLGGSTASSRPTPSCGGSARIRGPSTSRWRRS